MEFGEEIQMTKPFRSERDKAFINVMYTGSVLAESVSKILKKHNLNEQHFNILRILKGRHPGSACPGEIKSILLNKRGDLTRLLDKLDKMGYVHREANPENRRMINVTITVSGIQKVDGLSELIDSAEHKKNNLTEAEAKTLNTLLDKLRG